MFGSLFAGRRSQATKSHRSRPSPRSSKATTKARLVAQGNDGDESKDDVVQKPDVEELRRKRQSYYSLSSAQRRQCATTVATGSKSKSSRSTSGAGKPASKDGVRRRRKHADSTRSTTRTSSATSSNSRVEDFVYGTRPQAEHPAEPAPVDLSLGAERDGTAQGQHDRSARRQSAHYVSSKRRSLPTVIESEVTPDDSISQVAERKEDSRRAQHARGGYTRPRTKRSSTASSKLSSVAEDNEQHARHTASTRRPSTRDSSLVAPVPPPRRHSTSAVPSSTKLVDCLTCGSDDIPATKSAELSCGHRMCHDCLKRVFEMSVNDPAHMPPKCCNQDHIPLNHVDKLFDLKFKIMWNRKYQEYHTRNRIYCPAAKCGEWIKPKHIHKSNEGRKYALCPRCKTKVCTLCNNKSHKSTDCPKDPEIAKLVEQAKEEGWQRCYSCSAMVELQSGCNHMTCRCTAEFCMICGSKWKTCNCPWFNYSQLPNPDRLNDMRVPEPVRVIFRRVIDAAGGMPPPPPPAGQAPAGPPAEVTYQQELDDRRAQERADAELARRLQLASLWEDDDRQHPGRRRPPAENTWGIGNAAGHFMNDDFVQNAANVVMNAFGDANYGRRGERSSGRRRRARQVDGQQHGENRDPGLAPNFLGDESVLGVGPSARPR